MTERYDRQTLLPEIGQEGQRLLKQARVLIVGIGGLGSPAALYLAGAGVGTLGLVDDDRVSLTNLHRQVLYTQSEVGQPKVRCAARRLKALNPEVQT
ncbi:MAG: ThiF family adenylyltransferase, partial [Akkermansia sp.]|nr:ThiF family adenylyltransferase [Akkermansia sp.]